MTEQQACTLCGAGGHTAAQCKWGESLELLGDIIAMAASDSDDSSFESLCRKYLSEASVPYAVLEDTILGRARDFLASQQGEQATMAESAMVHPEQAEGAQGERVPDEAFEAEFMTWWEDHGQYCRSGGGDYERTFAFQAWRHLYPQLMAARAALAQPSPAPELERSTVYVEARQCDECQHGGINDSADGLAACHDCDWTGPDPAEDKCPGCQRENCMAAACPQCGARYVLVASEEIAAPVAQAGLVPKGVRAWFEAKQAHVNAVDAYNARLKFVREHCPFGTSVEPEYQLMEEADRKARSLVGPMFDELRGLLAAAPAQGGE